MSKGYKQLMEDEVQMVLKHIKKCSVSKWDKFKWMLHGNSTFQIET